MFSTPSSLEKPIDFSQLTAVDLTLFGRFYTSVQQLINRSGLDALKQLSAIYFSMKQEKRLKDVQLEALIELPYEMGEERRNIEQVVLNTTKQKLIEISQCLEKLEKGQYSDKKSPSPNPDLVYFPLTVS